MSFALMHMSLSSKIPVCGVLFFFADEVINNNLNPVWDADNKFTLWCLACLSGLWACYIQWLVYLKMGMATQIEPLQSRQVDPSEKWGLQKPAIVIYHGNKIQYGSLFATVAEIQYREPVPWNTLKRPTKFRFGHRNALSLTGSA